MSIPESRITIVMKKISGCNTPFWQSGYRILIPKAIVKKYEKKYGRSMNEIPLVFIETDKGVLLKPLPDCMNNPEMNGVQFAPLLGLTMEEMPEAINEIAEDET